MNILPIVLICLLALLAASAQTNRFYVTDESMPHHEPKTVVFSPQQIEKAKRAKESRPADEDPEGHWGAPSQGYQLSIRLEKGTFTNGEPVIASVLLRNVSDRPLMYWVSTLGRETEVVVAKGQERLSGKDEVKPGATFAERLAHLDVGSSWDCTSPVGSQRRLVLELDKLFDLTTNGQYTAQARRRVPTLDKKSEVWVVSGKTTFRISTP
jgi:hypothetical protein